jgi:uncharacterized protein involved in response to NO
MFLLGAMQLVLVMLLWFGELLARRIGVSLPFVVPSTWVHAVLMVYGVYIFFICGFLFTVFPRWMNGTEVARGRYMRIALTAATGMAISYIGFFTNRYLLAAGLTLHLLAWLGAIALLFAVYRSAPRRRVHERLLLLALTLGAIGLGAFIYATMASSAFAFGLARDIGLWGFLLPVLLTVCHRMIPFFTQSALANVNLPGIDWSLGWFVGGSLLHGFFEITSQPIARLMIDTALAALALRHTVVWGLTRSFRVRLLAMLHIAFLWFGIAMLLYAIGTAFRLIGTDIFGRAPLHALGIGFVTSTLIAMATRVTLGHSGRALAVKAPTWYLFLGISAVALLRIAAEIAPMAAYQWLNLLAAAAWLVCLVPWAFRYAPIYWRPRVDRKPG